MKKTVLRIISICLLCCLLIGSAGADWKQSNGRWWYDYGHGDYARNEWLKDRGNKYYFDGNGWMVTGWYQIKNKWYHFAPTGAMQTGWIQDGKTWFWLNKKGVMKTGWGSISGSRYFFGADGAMRTDWQQIDGYWYYFGNDGKMRKGWQKIGKDWYYFYTSGIMATNTVIDGYQIGPDGRMGDKVKSVLTVDRTSLYMDEFDTEYLTFTFTASGRLTYYIEDSGIVQCTWGDWYNNGRNIQLRVYGMNPGTTRIRVTNSYNSDEVVINVTVYP